MNQRIEDLAHISQQTTELLLAQLLSYALQESRKYDWASGVKKGEYIHGNTVLTKGKSPEDLVQEALESTITGSRSWNRQKHPELSVHLKLCIWGIANNLAKSWDNKNISPVLLDNNGQNNPLESMPATKLTPAPQLVQPDEILLLEECSAPMASGVFTKILDSMGGDTQLEILVGHLMNGEKPEDIAKKMGLSRKDVYRLMQKTRRHARQAFSGTIK